MSLQKKIQTVITAITGEPTLLVSSQAVYGGSINKTSVLTLKDGRTYFLKTHPRSAHFPGMFAAEFEAISLLADVNIIKVPHALCHDKDFILMETLEFGEKSVNWAEQIGTQLALTHQKTQAEQFGFKHDNYLGETPQPNSWSTDWSSFWREQRLGWQLQIFARRIDGDDDALLRLGDKLMASLDEIIGKIDEAPVLLHGDLWSGNASADKNGEPVIYDPASYYGQREAEIGMMRMFGGFGPACEAAYAEVWPFADEAERRFSVYRLYHELNHLNLFGRSYYDSCLQTIKSIL